MTDISPAARRLRDINGTVIKNPPLDNLRDPILHPSEDYWNEGSQDVVLHFRQGDFRSILNIMYSDDNGFYVLYGTPEHWKDNNYFIAITATTTSKQSTSIWFGGEETRLPRRLLLSSEECWSVISEFWSNGERSSVVEWVHASEELWKMDDE